MGLLDGKSIIITGAGRGIGAEYALAAAAEGAAVVVNDIEARIAEDTAAVIRAAGGIAITCVADVSDWGDAKRLVDACVEQFGAVDGLVNNAGVQIVGPPGHYDPQGIRRLMDINVLGTIFCGTHAIVRMRQAGHGSIVNVTSGAHMGLTAYSIYGASKGAISSLTHCWALDLDSSHVRVNAVSPRAATGMAQGFVDSLELTPGERQARIASFPSASSNAPVVVYLLSDLSHAVHGQTIRIDGERLSIVAKPAIQEPELIEKYWSIDKVVEAFDGPLVDSLMPPGLSRVIGQFRYETYKSEP